MHLQPMPVDFEPIPHLGILMVGGVVLNHDGSLAAISPGQLFEEPEVGGCVEDCVLSILNCVRQSSMAPRIFTLLRSPVTGTSGGQPTRLQVACRVESCRKLASSVKISAQCRAWAFF